MPKYYPMIYGRRKAKSDLFRMQKQHPKGNPLRYPLGLHPMRADISFGKNTAVREGAIRLNSNHAIKLSADKLATLEIWESADIPHTSSECDHFLPSNFITERGFDVERFREAIDYPVVFKKIYSSGGKGMKFVRNIDELTAGLAEIGKGPLLKSYYIERLFNFHHEYRIHAAPSLKGVPLTYQFEYSKKDEDGNWEVHESDPIQREDGIILGVRKMIRQEAHDSGNTDRHFNVGSVFFTTKFPRPSEWENMCSDAVKAIAALKLDFGFVDCLYNSVTGQYAFCESGSNPGMNSSGNRPTINVTAQHYRIALRELLNQKHPPVEIKSNEIGENRVESIKKLFFNQEDDGHNVEWINL